MAAPQAAHALKLLGRESAGELDKARALAFTRARIHGDLARDDVPGLFEQAAQFHLCHVARQVADKDGVVVVSDKPLTRLLARLNRFAGRFLDEVLVFPRAA